MQRVLYVKNWLEMMQEALAGACLCGVIDYCLRSEIQSPVGAVWIPTDGWNNGFGSISTSGRSLSVR